MARRKAFAYFRVSRSRTHRKKLEIVDQRARCRTFARDHGFRIVGEFIEIEYGKGIDAIESRPELQRCIASARAAQAPILVADVDRLARNVNFLVVLIHYGVTFIVTGVDAAAPPMILGPLRPRSLKLRGGSRYTEFGTHKRGKTADATAERHRDLTAIAAKGRRVRSQEAKQFALSLVPEIRRIQCEGKVSLRAIAAELNRRRIPSARDALWTPTAVRRVLDRAGISR